MGRTIYSTWKPARAPETAHTHDSMIFGLTAVVRSSCPMPMRSWWPATRLRSRRCSKQLRRRLPGANGLPDSSPTRQRRAWTACCKRCPPGEPGLKTYRLPGLPSSRIGFRPSRRNTVITRSMSGLPPSTRRITRGLLTASSSTSDRVTATRSTTHSACPHGSRVRRGRSNGISSVPRPAGTGRSSTPVAGRSPLRLRSCSSSGTGTASSAGR